MYVPVGVDRLLGVHFALLDRDRQRPFVRFKTNVAPYCVRGGVRVVSIQAHICFTILLARGTHPMYVQHLPGTPASS